MSKLVRVVKKNWYNIVIVLILLGAGLFYYKTLTPSVGFIGDDARYIILGESIASGQGFRLLCLPGAPPDRVCAPGFPFVLSLVWLILPEFPENVVALKSVSIIFAILFIFVTYLLLKGYFDKRLLLWVVVLTAFNPLILRYSTEVMTEMGYAFFSMLTFYYFYKYNTSSSKRDAFILIFALVSGYFFRPVGLLLFIFILAYLIIRREYARAWLIGGAFVICILPWMYRNFNVGAWGYVNALFQKNLEVPMGTVTLMDFVRRFFANVYFYATYGIPSIIFPASCSLRLLQFLESHNIRIIQTVGVLVFIMVPLLCGLFSSAVRKRELPALYTLGFVFLWCFWPWQENRFIISIIPFLFYYYFKGVTFLFQFFRIHWQSKYIICILSSIFLISAAVRGMDYLSPLLPGHQDEFNETFSYIRQNTPEESLLMCINIFQFYLYTERKCINPPSPEPNVTLQTVLHYGVDYIVIVPSASITGLGDMSQIFLMPLISTYPSLFRLIYQTEDGKFQIYEVVKCKNH